MRSFLVPDGADLAVQQAYAQVIAIHAALLPSGKILYFGGDQHDPGRHHLGMVDATRLFNCGTLAVTTIETSGLSDFFCCGHALLPSGQLLVGGGTQYWMNEVGTPGDPNFHARSGHFRGLPDTWRFDPSTETFHRVADMGRQSGEMAGGGRWYPTLLTLGTGAVAALAGHPSEADTQHFNYLVEVFHDDGGIGWWESVSAMPHDSSLYPRAHLLPDGRVFFSSPLHDGNPQGTSYAWRPHPDAWAPVCPGPGPAYDGFGATAVLLPLVPEDGYRPRVLLAGSSAPLRIDLGAVSPSWQPTGPRTLIDPGPSSPPRNNVNAVLLPTGDVAVVGGMRNVSDDPGSAVHEVELYRHETDSWVTLPAAANLSISRSYHSTALLMPDGRVWVAGSNVFCSWSFHNPSDYPQAGDYPNPQQPTTAQDDAIDHRHREIEIFEPWYFGRPDRPAFTLGSSSIATGGTLIINCPQAIEISRVVLLRAGSSTHSFNPDQRWVAVPFSLTAPGQITAHVPANANLLPPGPYLVFLLRQVVDPVTAAVLEVPSEGTFVAVYTSVMKPLKPELDLPRKDLLDTYRDPKALVDLPKMLGEGVVFPPEEMVGLLDRAEQRQIVSELAERLDRIETILERSKVFVRAELRPRVGSEPVKRSFAFTSQEPSIDPMQAGAAGMGGMGDMGEHGGPEHGQHAAPPGTGRGARRRRAR
jgi:hypothetical protein